MEENKKIEGLGDGFSLDKFLKARELAKFVTQKAASMVEVGMNEIEGISIIERLLQNYGCEKKWHPTKLRIGSNTIKSFKEKSEDGIVLGQNDIFFIDIGPVFDGHEADYGESFTIGSSKDLDNIKNAARETFSETKVAFQDGLSGKELYKFAENITKKKGYILNLNMKGHRLGDFPHALFYRGKLGDIDFIPQRNLWILEILIRHPEKAIGSFFEDLI